MLPNKTSLVSLAIILLSLSGCANNLSTEDITTASVMPQSAAIKIFQKYGFADITQKFNWGKGSICSSYSEYLPIGAVTSFRYYPASKRIDMLSGGICYNKSSIYDVQNIDNAKELLKAARSLGANVDSVTVMQEFWKY